MEGDSVINTESARSVGVNLAKMKHPKDLLKKCKGGLRNRFCITINRREGKEISDFEWAMILPMAAGLERVYPKVRVELQHTPMLTQTGIKEIRAILENKDMEKWERINKALALLPHEVDGTE